MHLLCQIRSNLYRMSPCYMKVDPLVYKHVSVVCLHVDTEGYLDMQPHAARYI